jgi:hypothetical protein
MRSAALVVGLLLALGAPASSAPIGKTLLRTREAPATKKAPPPHQTDWLTRAAAKIAPHKFQDEKNPFGPNRITEERPFAEMKGSLFGLEVGITFSELHQIRAKSGIEVVHVVNPNGGSNLELVLARKEIGKGQRVELQGPAINTSLAPGELPLGFRVAGIGLTSDLVDRKSKEAVSYTAEVKVTDRTVLEGASLLGATGVGGAIAGHLGGTGARMVSEVFSAAVPVVGVILFASSAKWAWKVVHDPSKSRLDKTLAVAHAASDAVRIAFPLAGAIGNAAITGLSAGLGLYRMHKLKQEFRAREARETQAEAPRAPPAQTR